MSPRDTFARLDSSATAANNAGSGRSTFHLRVQLQVAGIHCPSCVKHITRLLQLLDLPIDSNSISVSFLDHTVSFHLPLQHPSSNDIHGEQEGTLRKVVAALKEEGFQPNAIECKVINSGGSAGNVQDSQHSRTVIPFELEEGDGVHAKSKGLGFLEEEQQHWSVWNRLCHPREYAAFKEANQEKERKWKRHLEVCSSCREGSDQASVLDQQQSSNSSKSIVLHKGKDDEDEQEKGDNWVAGLAISGMTCSACVSNVQKAAETVEGVKKIQVTLMTSSARLNVVGEDTIDAVIEAINDAGYDAELVSKQQEQKQPTKSLLVWKATYSVGGMTCASCVSNVEKAVKASDDDSLLSFNVALMQGSAIATFTMLTETGAQKKADGIRESIEDAGYDCALEDLCREEGEDSVEKTDRTVRIRVDGMFCHHCTTKLQRYFRDHSYINVKEADLTAITLASPTITINYTPSSFTTIRSILADIDALDPAFQARVVTPPSISSRSAMHARRELYSLLTRLILAFLFVPPTLVIAVIVPTFLSASDPLRISLSTQIVGQASKGNIILWVMATPVQFGIGQVFYQRAFKSLRSVWRSGRSWQDRLISWGDMNVLVALGTSVAYIASFAFLMIDMSRKKTAEDMEESMTYFDACVFLICEFANLYSMILFVTNNTPFHSQVFILLGRVLEAWSKRKTTSAVSALGSLRPSSGLLLQEPELLTSSAVIDLQVELLEVDDLVLVPSGSSPPLDSVLVGTPSNPTANFLESAISGESKAVTKQDGDQLYAGTVNQSKTAIIARVKTLAGSNLIDNVIEIVQSSSSRKADVEQLADKVTSHFVPLIVLLAVLVLIIWIAVLFSPGAVSDQWKEQHIQNYNRGGSQFLYALQFAVSVLVVACPCGIGLAAPTAQIIAIGLASKQGILVQGGGQAFQSAVQLAKRKVSKAFVFDKTGTITHGNDGNVQDVHLELLSKPWSQEALSKAIWLMEGNSGHPISAGIRKWCETQSMESIEVEIDQVDEIAGRGLRARATFQQVQATLLIGSMAFINEESDQVVLSDESKDRVSKWQSQGASVVFVAATFYNSEEGDKACKIVAILSLADTIRSEAKATIDYLGKKYGGQVWMVSGDTIRTAKAIASQVGISENHVVAGVLPTEKSEWVERIKKSDGKDLESNSRNGRMVAFVGDGINDAPALSSADLSIALGSGSSLATSTASFILLNSDRPLASIPAILSLSQATQSKIWQNLAWACAFNVVFIPIAAGAFVEKGFTFGPSWSGLAMALSSVSVVLNALTLRLWRAPKVKSL